MASAARAEHPPNTYYIWVDNEEECSVSNKNHWNDVYRTKSEDAVSWYAAHLDTSLRMIQHVAPMPEAAIIDVGGGEATLADDLLALGYRDLTVLDISETAIQAMRERLGTKSASVEWLVTDVTTATLPSARYDVWHDRAVFHFLTDPADRQAYIAQATQSVKADGFLVVATFGPDGPLKCSGLDTVRYDAAALQAEFGAGFALMDSTVESHQTPFGTSQQFVYCLFNRK